MHRKDLWLQFYTLKDVSFVYGLLSGSSSSARKKEETWTGNKPYMLRIAELNIALYCPLLNLNTLAFFTIVIWNLYSAMQGAS